MPIDTHYLVATPEGIQLTLSPAGPIPRMLAWVIDLLIRTSFLSAIYFVLWYFDHMGIGLFLIITFSLEWFYPVFFEVLRHGQTPGKRVMGIYVSHVNAIPVNLSSSIIRNFLRVVDFLPFMYGFALVSMLLNKKFQRLGDLVANTVVLYQDTPNKTISLADVKPVQPPISLSLAEQQAIIAYAQRSDSLSEERANELATTTGSLLEPHHSPHATLKGMGAWLAGIR